MKIAFVEPHLELYGGIRRILELAHRLARMGEDVTIYHPKGKPCQWMSCDAKVYPLSELTRRAHDAVIFNNPPDCKHVRKAEACSKVFYILELYEKERLKRFNPKIFWPKRGRILSLKRALQMPFWKISNATWMQRYLREHLGIESDLLIGGVNREIFHPVELRKNPREFRILCTGDPRERKGTETVVKAIGILKREFPSVVLDTYYGKSIPQHRMAETYCAADLFVDAQWYAGWNNPVAEAMACKVPVVCTDIGGVADFAIHEKTALLVPPKNPEQLAAALTRMIRSNALREDLRKRAYHHILQFDWDQATQTFREMLSARLGKRAPVEGSVV
jgi:glycosyltransferase involved in cell wall biosynthesis